MTRAPSDPKLNAAQVVLLVLGCLFLLVWCGLPLLAELAPGLLAPLRPFLHAYLFGP